MSSKLITDMLNAQANPGPYQETHLSRLYVRDRAKMVTDGTVKLQIMELRFLYNETGIYSVEARYENGEKDYFGRVKLAARAELRELMSLETTKEDEALNHFPAYKMLDMDEIHAPN